MTYKRKSWHEKLHEPRDLPRVEPMPEKMKPRHGEGTILIPAPLEVDALMRQVPAGKLTTVNQLRAVLAERH